MEQRESLIFYRSFYEAIKELPLEQQWEVYNAIFEYWLDFNEIKLEWIPKIVFTLIKPQLQANRKKYLNWKKQKTNKSEAKVKQNISKSEAKHKQNISKTQGNVNDNDNVNKNDNKNDNKETKKRVSYVSCDNFQLKDVKIEFEKVISYWNEIFEENRQVTETLQKEYILIRKKYSKEDFRKSINWYMNNKLAIKKQEWKFKYLLSPTAFLKNKKNWFESYL